jgi:hypothetical protein
MEDPLSVVSVEAEALGAQGVDPESLLDEGSHRLVQLSFEEDLLPLEQGALDMGERAEEGDSLFWIAALKSVMLGPALELDLLDEASFAQDPHPLGILGDLLKMVRGEQDAGAALSLFDQDAVDQEDALRVETARRLIEDQELGPVEQGSGEAEALTLAEGVTPSREVRNRKELEALQRLLDALGRLSKLKDPGLHLEVLSPAEIGIKRGGCLDQSA